MSKWTALTKIVTNVTSIFFVCNLCSLWSEVTVTRLETQSDRHRNLLCDIRGAVYQNHKKYTLVKIKFSKSAK